MFSNKTLLSDLGPVYSFNQLDIIYNQVNSIIENLDDSAIKELTSGYEKDFDTILKILIEETGKAIFSKNADFSTQNFSYLNNLATTFDFQLKRKSFNYFTQSTLPNFEQSFHHIEWGNLLQLYQWLNVLAARDHSKSYTFSFAYPLWKMFRYDRYNLDRGLSAKENSLNKMGMIITNEHSLSKKFLGFIVEEIENNPILRERLYPDKGNGMGKEEIVTKNGATLEVKGLGSALRVRHPTWIVNDDLLDESSLYSKDQRELAIETMHSTIMNLIVPLGQVIVVGTPMHHDDLYGNLKKAPGWRVFEYPAINPDGTVLWPTRYSLQTLLNKKKSQGSIIFSREILVKPVSSDSTIFPYKILQTAFRGMDEICIADNILSYKKKFKKVAMGCDFAISSEIGADYSAFTIMGLDELDNYYLIYQWREKGVNYNQQIARMKKMKLDFKPDVIIGEDNAFQKVMIDMANDAGINIIGHTTGVNKYDLRTGLPGLATLFEQGRIKFPRGDERSKNMTDVICMEAAGVTWSNKGKLENTTDHDDGLMSCWLTVRGLNYLTKNSFNFTFF